MKSKTQKIVLSAMLAAVCCVVTMVVKVPSPFKGNINLGDCVVLLSGWILPPGYSFLAAAVGSALADVLSGFIIYAPITFFLKGFMAVAAYYLFKFLHKRTGKFPAWIAGGILAEIIMVAGYYVFEGFLYGFVPSAVNIPLNAVQGLAGLILGIILVKIFDKKGM